MVPPKKALQKMSHEKNKEYFWWTLLLTNLFRKGTHMGKREEKKIETEKREKRL